MTPLHADPIRRLVECWLLWFALVLGTGYLAHKIESDTVTRGDAQGEGR